MRILHVINNLKREGAQKLLIDIVSNELNRENEIDIVLLENKNDFEDAIASHNNIKVIVSVYGKYSLGNFRTIYSLIKKKNYNVMHSHLFPANYYCAFVAPFFKKVTNITTEHSTNNRRRNKLIFRIIESFLYKSYDIIIGISDATTHKLKSFLFFKNNILTVNNGIDFTKIESIKNEQSKDLERIKELKKEGFFILIMIARFTSLKNHKIVIEALNILDKNFHLVLIGEGETYEEINNNIKTYNLCNRIHFLGIQENIFPFLKQADISIIPSLWEGFGLVAIESMACGIPTIVSDVDGLSNIVENGALKFNVNKASDLKEKIMTLYNSDELKNELKEKGLLISKKYNITNTIKAYQSIYNS
ncbi:glycosyltransferase [uncultured Maribacter sp.]|uniref:glycosyltransferase n=1 Tax=uncultured Maribacter sp. TaxID=431308 RepID=UPI0026321531|nr:glycosyltransferase [uncultured Maribacter sp.]